MNSKELVNSFKKTNKELIKQYLLENIEEKMKKIYFRKKKIMHLLASNSFSGAENVVCQIIDMFKENDEFDMIYVCPKGDIKRKLEEKNVKYYFLEKFNVFKLKRAIININPDVIHAHDVGASFIASFIKNVQIISHIHGNHLFMRKFTIKSLLYQLATSKIKHIFWVSNSAFESYYFKEKVTNKSSVLINVINKNEIIKSVQDDKNNYDYDIIFIGRLMEAKNPVKLIEVLSLIISKRPNTKCCIIGDGEMMKKCKETIEHYQLTENIDMLGFLHNPYKVLYDSKILMMTSVHEGTPMVALEAMSLGKPIVSTITDGMVDLVDCNINGFLSNDNEILAEKCIFLLNNKDKLIEFSKNIIEKFYKLNDINLYKNTINKYY